MNVIFLLLILEAMDVFTFQNLVLEASLLNEFEFIESKFLMSYQNMWLFPQISQFFCKEYKQRKKNNDYFSFIKTVPLNRKVNKTFKNNDA